jgi:hypothetical protein
MIFDGAAVGFDLPVFQPIAMLAWRSKLPANF